MYNQEQFIVMKETIVLMGKQTCTAVEKAISALLINDITAASEVRRIEKEVDELFAFVDKHCLDTLAEGEYSRGQLVFLLNSLKIAIELERICDYANQIAKLVQRKFSQQDMQEIDRLAIIVSIMKTEVAGMLQCAVKAYEFLDLGLIAGIQARENIVDEKTKEVFRGILCILSINQWVQELVLDYHVAVRYVERTADRALNITEFVSAIVKV